MIVYWLLLLAMTFLGSIASLFLKKASDSGTITGILKNINFYIGGFLYFISAVLNIIVLKYLDYSVVLPLTSFTYVWTMILSYCILSEKITKKKVFGVCLIILGAVAVSL